MLAPTFYCVRSPGTRIGGTTVHAPFAQDHIWTRYHATHDKHGVVWLWEFFPMAIARRGAFDQIVARDGRGVLLKAQLSSLKERASQLRHCECPSLVRFLDIVDANGTIYVLTPVVPGATWHKAVRNKKTTTARVVAISHRLIDAIVVAHETTKSVLEIHDHSVFVTDQNQVVIAALGANWLAIEADPACQSIPNGTDFLPPLEISASDSPSKPDERTDIYLAASLIKQAINAAVARAPSTQFDFPHRLRQAVDLALAPDLKDRPLSAAMWRRDARELNQAAIKATIRATLLTSASLAIGIVLYTAAASTILLDWRMQRDWAELPNTVAALSRYAQEYPWSTHIVEASRRGHALEREAQSALALASAKGREGLDRFMKITRFRGSEAQTLALKRLLVLNQRNIRIDLEAVYISQYDLDQVNEYLRRYRNDPHALSRGYIAKAQAARQSLLGIEPQKPEPPRNPEIDSAFEALTGSDDPDLAEFLKKYAEHSYAASRGYTAQVRSWREQLRSAAEEQKLRDEQSKAELSYD